MRVRDEIKMTIQAYQTLYESSIAYGMRKALMAEQGKNETQTAINDLEAACRERDEAIERQQQNIEKIIRDAATTFEAE